MIRPSVVDNWVKLNSPLEGVFKWMYQDVKRFITAAMGNLADPVSLALQLAWRLPSGELASKQQVMAEHASFKAQPLLANYSAYSRVVQQATTVRLDDAGVLDAVRVRLLANEARMRRYFPGWDGFPADAQAGLMSIAWAVGADFEATFINCTASANRGDFLSCAIEGHIQEAGNAGVVPRNKQNVLLFHNAAAVVAQKLDPSVLWWPSPAPSVDPSIHSAAEQSFADAPHAPWEQRLDQITDEAWAEINTGHSSADTSDWDDEPPTRPN